MEIKAAGRATSHGPRIHSIVHTHILIPVASLIDGTSIENK